MYIATIVEEVQDAIIIIGTLLIHSTPSVALIDSGSTHTLIAKIFVVKIRLPIEDDIGYGLVILTPTDECVRGVAVVI